MGKISEKLLRGSGVDMNSAVHLTQSKASMLLDWRKDGVTLGAIHPKSKVFAYTRLMHWVPIVRENETDTGLVKKEMRKSSFVCANHLTKSASACPFDVLLDYIQDNSEIADDDVLFRYDTGDDNSQEITRADVFGNGPDWKVNFNPKFEFIVPWCPTDEKNSDPVLMQLPAGAGKDLVATIKDRAEELTPEKGNPLCTPVLFKIKYNKAAKPADMYKVLKSDLDIPDNVKRMFDSPVPDSSMLLQPTLPSTILDYFDKYYVGPGLNEIKKVCLAHEKEVAGFRLFNESNKVVEDDEEEIVVVAEPVKKETAKQEVKAEAKAYDGEVFDEAKEESKKAKDEVKQDVSAEVDAIFGDDDFSAELKGDKPKTEPKKDNQDKPETAKPVGNVLVPCAKCEKMMLVDSKFCPHCGDKIDNTLIDELLAE